jgi:hypothetical protein
MTSDPHDWSVVTAARLRATGLGCLAAVRHRPEVRVTVGTDGFAWVQWPAGPLADEIVSALRLAAGVEFYGRHAGDWRRFGSRLPSGVTTPKDAGRLLAEVLIPAAVVPVLPIVGAIQRLGIEIVRDDVPRPATALRCTLREFAAWADTATTRQLAGIRAAISGGEVLVLGTLPTIAFAQRYWGDAVYLPLGLKLRPALNAASVRELLQAAADDLIFWHGDGVEVVPQAAFEPVARAGVRLACETGSRALP